MRTGQLHLPWLNPDDPLPPIDQAWPPESDAPGLLAAGIALHAFGVLHIALAGIVSGLALSLDYAAPVLALPKRLRLLPEPAFVGLQAGLWQLGALGLGNHACIQGLQALRT